MLIYRLILKTCKNRVFKLRGGSRGKQEGVKRLFTNPDFYPLSSIKPCGINLRYFPLPNFINLVFIRRSFSPHGKQQNIDFQNLANSIFLILESDQAKGEDQVNGGRRDCLPMLLKHFSFYLATSLQNKGRSKRNASRI